jgi:DNA-binding GntR family transcriptional regulator
MLIRMPVDPLSEQLPDAAGEASGGPVAPAGTASAMARRAYEAVRHDIVNGDLAPGTWLREPAVAASLGLSRTPVREALRMLAAEGVVELVHNRGARVVEWTAADIDEIYRLRALLEGHGAALAARDATAAQVAELRHLAERYERAVDDEGRTPGLSARCNNAFHAAVVAASGSSRLQTLLDVISSVPLVTQALGRYTDDDRRRSVLQHRDILTAIAHHDEGLAESAMRSHILAARYTALHVASVTDEPPA